MDKYSKGTYCPPDPPLGGSCSDISWPLIFSQTLVEIIHNFPLILCFIAVPSLIGYVISQRVSHKEEDQKPEGLKEIDIQPISTISPRYAIIFGWAGFVIGVIVGAALFNYFEIMDTGAPLFMGILLLCGGVLSGFKYAQSLPSQPDIKYGTVFDILLLVFMVITALVVLFIGMMVNTDWSIIFS